MILLPRTSNRVLRLGCRLCHGVKNFDLQLKLIVLFLVVRVGARTVEFAFGDFIIFSLFSCQSSGTLPLIHLAKLKILV